MKIVYISDVHSDFDKFGIAMEYAKKVKPDLIQISGDIIDFSLRNPKRFQKHTQLAQALMLYAQNNEPGLRRLTPYEIPRALPIIAEKIYENPPNENLEGLVKAYLTSLDFAEGNMDIQYDLLKDIADKTGIDYNVLAGNYDKDLQLSSLREKDLHKKTIERNGIIISGFGGANDFQRGNVVPFGIPPELTIPFNEYPNRAGQTISEIFNFLTEEKPDVAFTHAPPKGFRDLMKDPQTGQLVEKGSPGLTKYLQQGDTKILCCGHMHESVGVKKMITDKGPVIIFNGGSLRDGYFGEIIIDDKTKKMDKISLYQIKGKLILLSDLEQNLDVDNVKLLMEYVLTPDGELKKLKIDLNDKHDY